MKRSIVTAVIASALCATSTLAHASESLSSFFSQDMALKTNVGGSVSSIAVKGKGATTLGGEARWVLGDFIAVGGQFAGLVGATKLAAIENSNLALYSYGGSMSVMVGRFWGFQPVASVVSGQAAASYRQEDGELVSSSGPYFGVGAGANVKINDYSSFSLSFENRSYQGIHLADLRARNLSGSQYTFTLWHHL